MPIEHLEELLNVYITLTQLKMPDVIRCRSFKVNRLSTCNFTCVIFTWQLKGALMHIISGFWSPLNLPKQVKQHVMVSAQIDRRTVDLRNKEQAMPDLPRDTICPVELKLEPVGVSFTIHSENELHSVVTSLLSTLRTLHEAGYVHRDVRMDNVIKYFDQWVLIDWELAGRVDQFVWWNAKVLPDPVKLREQPYTVKSDLWQLGKLIMSHYRTLSPAVSLFAQQLVKGDFQSAAQAQGHMWAIT